MLEMRRHDLQVIFAAQLPQDHQQRQRIRAARARCDNAVPTVQQPMFQAELLDLFQHTCHLTFLESAGKRTKAPLCRVL